VVRRFDLATDGSGLSPADQAELAARVGKVIGGRGRWAGAMLGLREPWPR